MEQAWSGLRELVGADMGTAAFSAQLGLSHARLGLLHLGQDGQSAMAAAVIDSYVRVWIQQMWRVDPASQIVRWERVAKTPKLLISSIDLRVYSLLEAFTQRHRLRFISCKPAVLSAPELAAASSESSDASRLVVWTEPSATAVRSPLVQLMHCKNGQTVALWRGWVPAQEQENSSDTALDGAVRRFCAAYAPDQKTALVARHWEHTRREHLWSQAAP